MREGIKLLGRVKPLPPLTITFTTAGATDEALKVLWLRGLIEKAKASQQESGRKSA